MGFMLQYVDVVFNGILVELFDVLEGVSQVVLCVCLGLFVDVWLVGLFSCFVCWKGQYVLLEVVVWYLDMYVVLVGVLLFGEDDYVV